MPQITIETTQEEQEAVYEALKRLGGKVVAVREIAEEAGIPQSRARYALVDLLEAKKVTREAHKQFNKHYVRYSYKVN